MQQRDHRLRSHCKTKASSTSYLSPYHLLVQGHSSSRKNTQENVTANLRLLETVVKRGRIFSKYAGHGE
ncbi:hypothetical protein E2C01_047050 [Portunus trituberculatus]|uniref:Uncharacterized protein n=1 Tax=Portunus trituberculatus TaxID=210409 RepID=A0A5B7G9F3_PORTR|nr:hypothetical protein [Portunus trituberculatus]